MKKVISVIAILLLLVGSLAACSEEAPPAEKLDDISGIWVAEADYGEIIKQAINTNNNKDLEKHLKLGEFKVQIEFVFNADGTYQRSRLAEFSEKDLAAMKKALKAGYIAFYENTLGEEVLQGRTVEAYLKQQGLSLDGKLREITEQTLPQVFAGIDVSGQYKVVKGGKIWFSTLPDSMADGKNYWTYTLKGDTLTLLSAEATAGEETISFPQTLKKSK